VTKEEVLEEAARRAREAMTHALNCEPPANCPSELVIIDIVAPTPEQITGTFSCCEPCRTGRDSALFDWTLCWRLSDEKAVAIGKPHGLASWLRRHPIDQNRVFFECAPFPDEYGKVWDERRWQWPFDVRALVRLGESAVPAHAFERPTAEMMELAIQCLVSGQGHRVKMEPTGKWEAVAADAVVKFIGDRVGGGIRNELASRPLKGPPRYRWVPDQSLPEAIPDGQAGSAMLATMTCHREEIS
jgi:hypothetical protein